MKLSEKIQEALREQLEISLSDPAVQKRLAAHWGYVPAEAQPAPSVPREAVEKMLTQLMDIAVSNGANSISMPDEYVEVAAWLCGIPAQPAPSFADAYQGAMEEVAIWKKRALEAEDLNRKFVAEINGPTYMGEPPHSKSDCGEARHDEGRCGNRQCLPGAQGEGK